MAKSKRAVTEYRSYYLPMQFPVLLLSGDYWKISDIPSGSLHFHNCLEIGICHSDSGTLEINGEKVGVEVFSMGDRQNPVDIAKAAVEHARNHGHNVVILDTAGRLHNKTNLMNELNKISRIVERELPNASREVLLVLDGTTGQNGLIQAKQFKEIAGVTALAVTKLDGTAKGGIVIAVADTLGLPVKFIGVGEKAEDLMRFQAKDFVDALFE